MSTAVPLQETGSRAFKFDIAAPPGWEYAGGDTIIGNIVRHTPVVAPEATITLVLTGRTKVKITERNGNSSSVYREEYRLVSTATETIFRGPLHLPENSDESLSWPFELQIPREPLVSARNAHSQAASFLLLDIEHPCHHILPGSFFSCRDGFNTTSYAKIEYCLTATLRYQFGGRNRTHEATYPVNIRHPSVPVPSTKRNKLHTFVRNATTLTHRLLPGMESAELTLKQKTQKLLSSSKVPSYAHKLELTVPSTIQLDNPTPLPITLDILPLPHTTSPSIRDIPQHIHINWINMTLKSHTRLLAPSNTFSSMSHDDHHKSTHSLNLMSAFRALDSPLTITRPDKASEALPIGEMFQLTLHADGLRSDGRRLGRVEERIYPDFLTYSIMHTHQMKWEVSVTIAGETQVHEFKGGVVIIAE